MTNLRNPQQLACEVHVEENTYSNPQICSKRSDVSLFKIIWVGFPLSIFLGVAIHSLMANMFVQSWGTKNMRKSGHVQRLAHCSQWMSIHVHRLSGKNKTGALICSQFAPPVIWLYTWGGIQTSDYWARLVRGLYPTNSITSDGWYPLIGAGWGP